MIDQNKMIQLVLDYDKAQTRTDKLATLANMRIEIRKAEMKLVEPIIIDPEDQEEDDQL